MAKYKVKLEGGKKMSEPEPNISKKMSEPEPNISKQNQWVKGVLVGLLVIAALGFVFISSDKKSHSSYDEVVYDCGNFIVVGTKIPGSEYDLDNGVDSYYLSQNEDTARFNLSIREWHKDFFGSVSFEKDGCKEILRFYNYTKLQKG